MRTMKSKNNEEQSALINSFESNEEKKIAEDAQHNVIVSEEIPTWKII